MAQCATCSKKLEPSAVFTYKEQTFCDSCYVGDDGFGPLEEQFIPCPSCGKRVHRFSIRCRHCRAAIRSVGKIEAAAKGSSVKGIVLVVSLIGFALLTMFFIQRGVQLGQTGKAVGLSLLGLALAVNGLFGVLYFRSLAFVLPLKGIGGFAVGAISLILGVVSYVVLI